MTTTTHHIYCNLHGNGVANSGSYPVINANFDIEFTREAGSSTVSWRTYNNTWSGTSSGNGHFAFQFYAYISINDSTPTWDDLKYLIYKDTTSWTTSWWNQVQLPTRNGTFTSTSSTMTLYIWVQSGLCTNGDAGGSNCYYNEYTASGRHFDLVKTFTLAIPEYEANYTVSYDANGGVGAPESQTKSSLSDLQLSTDIPTYLVNITHHNNPNNVLSVNRPFLKWTTNRDGTGASFSPGQAYRINADVTLYAQWGNASFSPVAVPENLITVTYDYRGATWSPAYTTIASPALGYNTNSSATTATYIPGTTYTTTTNLDLYPIYGAATLAYNSLPVPERSGYTFEGWYSDIDYKTKVTSDLTLTTNITLYAKWKLMPVHMLGGGGNWDDINPYVWQCVDGTWEKIAPVYGFDGDKWINLSEGLEPYGIFNFGEVVGLRPEFAEGVEIAKQYSYTAAWQITTSRIYLDYTANSRMTLGGQLRKGFYKYLYVEVDAGGASRTYNNSQLGIRYVKNGKGGTDTGNVANAYIPFTQYAERTLNTYGYNYIDRTVRNKNVVPYWYYIPRMITRLDLSTVTQEPFYLTMHACDCSVNIYRIWLE